MVARADGGAAGGAGPDATAGRTADWYDAYYRRRGADRNDILANRGVLMQVLAMQRGMVESLRAIGADPQRTSVLDVGCGKGTRLAEFATLGFPAASLHGVDILPDRIAEASRILPGSHFRSADASRLEYDDGAFDLVTSSTMFVQLTDEVLAEAVAREMCRVTRPGGHVIVTDWRYDMGRREYRAANRARLLRLFAGMTLVRERPGALVPPVGRFLSARLPSLYFPIQRLIPFLTGQVVTTFRRT